MSMWERACVLVYPPNTKSVGYSPVLRLSSWLLVLWRHACLLPSSHRPSIRLWMNRWTFSDKGIRGLLDECHSRITRSPPSLQECVRIFMRVCGMAFPLNRMCVVWGLCTRCLWDSRWIWLCKWVSKRFFPLFDCCAMAGGIFLMWNIFVGSESHGRCLHTALQWIAWPHFLGGWVIKVWSKCI